MYTGKETLNNCSPGPALFETARRKDTTGRIARNLKALADTEKYQHTSSETYCEVRALVYGNLKAALNETQA